MTGTSSSAATSISSSYYGNILFQQFLHSSPENTGTVSGSAIVPRNQISGGKQSQQHTDVECCYNDFLSVDDAAALEMCATEIYGTGTGAHSCSVDYSGGLSWLSGIDATSGLNHGQASQFFSGCLSALRNGSWAKDSVVSDPMFTFTTYLLGPTDLDSGSGAGLAGSVHNLMNTMNVNVVGECFLLPWLVPWSSTSPQASQSVSRGFLRIDAQTQNHSPEWDWKHSMYSLLQVVVSVCTNENAAPSGTGSDAEPPLQRVLRRYNENNFGLLSRLCHSLSDASDMTAETLAQRITAPGGTTPSASSERDSSVV